MTKMLALMIGIGMQVTSIAAQADDTGVPKILRAGADTPLPDFSYAGYGFGSGELPPSPPESLHVEDFGAIADDTIDDSAAFQKALAEAHAHIGPITLKMGAGRFILSEILNISRSEMSLEGASSGAGGTELYFPRPLRMVPQAGRFEEIKQYLLSENKLQIEPERNINLPFSPYSWTGGFIWVSAQQSRPFAYLDRFEEKPAAPAKNPLLSGKANALSVRTNADSKLKAGDWVRIQWFSTRGKQSALIEQIYGTKPAELVSAIGSRLWEDPKRALVTQITRIQKRNGQLLTLANPLMHDIDADRLPASISQWQGLRGVTLRDFAIRFPEGVSFGHHLEEGYNGIYFSDVVDGWIDSIRIVDADSGILSYNCASSTISKIRTEGQRRAHYSVHLGNVNEVLVQDLEVHNKVVHPLSFNNFSTRSVYQRATLWQEAVIDQHAGVNQQNLIDQLKVYVHAGKGSDGQIQYPLWNGSGAPYWQPGHGRFNTHWNIQVNVESGADPQALVLLTGLDEGPDARIVGVYGNRKFKIDYRPKAYLEAINQRVSEVPSLYDWQRQRQLRFAGSKR